jgi:hypothetical protein
MIMAKEKTRSLTLLGHSITPDLVREISQKASKSSWGTHLLRWRYFEPEEGALFFRRQIDAVKINRMEWNVLIGKSWNDWSGNTTGT